MKNLFYLCLAIVLCQACQDQSLQSTSNWGVEYPAKGAYAEEPMNTENYAAIVENQFTSPQDQPLSTFSIDVDYASYSNTRRFIKNGSLPPVDAVRIEELVNYFPYHYAEPMAGQPFSVHTELSPCPWQPENQLLHIGLKAKEVPMAEVPASNLVFLLDVSGSMSSPDKLPLLINSFQLLTNQLRSEDRVAIVVYAGASGVVLPSTPGNQKDRILAALEGLEAGGSTAGSEGIELAYQIAEEHFIQNGNNRIILATDGDFNVGVSSEGALRRLIEQKREKGVFLSVLGFGTGNIQDVKMETLADHGNGQYAYIDDLMEARKFLVTELSSTLLTVAKDVKIQIEFNPERVGKYRLIGYENRLLAAEDFNNDQKDAGEIGAGHTVTALYELMPPGTGSAKVDPLKYQAKTSTSAAQSGEWGMLKLRYKEPQGSTSKLIAEPITQADWTPQPSEDLAFSSAVAGFGMLLRKSEHAGNMNYEQVLALARSGKGEDYSGYRAGFIQLVELAKELK